MGYLVEVKRADSGDWIRCNVPKNLQETKYTITGLLENTEYKVRVTAVNKVGFGEPSEVPGTHLAKEVLSMLLLSLYECNTGRYYNAMLQKKAYV